MQRFITALSPIFSLITRTPCSLISLSRLRIFCTLLIWNQKEICRLLFTLKQVFETKSRDWEIKNTMWLGSIRGCPNMNAPMLTTTRVTRKMIRVGMKKTHGNGLTNSTGPNTFPLSSLTVLHFCKWFGKSLNKI